MGENVSIFKFYTYNSNQIHQLQSQYNGTDFDILKLNDQQLYKLVI